MKVGGRIVVFVRNPRIADKSGEFAQVIAGETLALDPLWGCARGCALHSRQRGAASRAPRDGKSSKDDELRTVGWCANRNAWGRLVAWIVAHRERRCAAAGRRKPPSHISSFVMRLSVDAPRIYDEEANSALRLKRRKKGEGDYPVAAMSADSESGAEETREPQYNRCVDLKNSFGLTSLGLMTNQVWYDDPRRLTFLLARYKFVAKMLGGRGNAGEVGCGDAFGTRVVLQEVPDVTVYDFDPVFIDDIRARHDNRWPLKAEVHDIVASRLPRQHEALFSLDVIEHITRSDEHAYLSNLVRLADR